MDRNDATRGMSDIDLEKTVSPGGTVAQRTVTFRHSEDTLHGDEKREKRASEPRNSEGLTLQQELQEAKLQIPSEQRAIVGGKYAQDEANLAKYTNLTKFDFDLPLTLTEEIEHQGKNFILLHFVEGDIEDPFNWNPRRKAYISVLLCLMTLTIGMATTAYSSGIGSMTEEFGVSETLGEMGLFVFNMTCAVAPLILAPFCELLGRWVIYVGSYVGFCVMFIGLALGKNITTILILRTFLGLFGCVGTILVGGTFSDMYYSEQRAIPIAAFSWVAIFGTVFAPVYAGFIDMTIGWRWIEGIQGLANVPLLILIAVTFKETRGEVGLGKRAAMIRKKTKDERYICGIDLDKMSIKDLLKAASVKAIHMLVTEAVVLAFGIWIAFAWFVTFLFLSVIPITFMEKRGFNEGVAGLPYISLCIGVTLAFIANFWNMKKYKALTADPDVVVVPEHRLYGAMYGGVALPIGLFIYSFTQYGYLPWIAPTIALAPISFGKFLCSAHSRAEDLHFQGIFFIFEACYSYTSDCYGESSGSAIAGQGLLRNTLGAVSICVSFPLRHAY